MENDYSSTAFWYQAEPHKPFPKLPDAGSRHPRVNDTPFDNAHMTHMEFRKAFSLATVFLAEKGVQVPFYLDRELLYFYQEIEELKELYE